MSRRWDNDFEYFAESKPLAAKGGIKAQSRRGAFVKNWWAKRWISVLESFEIGARLGRGRRYARGGQVLNVDIDRGMVTAEVQGSRPKPYRVVVAVEPLAPEKWTVVGEYLASQALFAARLLAGEMPQDIETAFAEVGLSLFPARGELKTHCSCPDWSNPCKHIAAVYYLLGEEFDRDPFLIFKLRGMDRDGLMDLLGAAQAAPTAEVLPEPQVEPLPAEPLPTDPADFWHPGKLPDDLFGEVRIPAISAALLRRLGGFPFWRGERPFQGALEPTYSQAALRGLAAFVPENDPSEGLTRKEGLNTSGATK